MTTRAHRESRPKHRVPLPFLRILCVSAMMAALLVHPAGADDGWWMREPIRWVQTNLRQTDATLDPARLVDQLAAMRANVLLEGMGGIVAYYPTAVPFHYPSPYLPAGRDLFGEILRQAHAGHIRVVGRFDFSKTRKDVYDAHPEWFFRQSNGEPVIYNGLYSTCINGGYYREQALKILAEGLGRYDVDGLFFNMFGNQSADYSGRPVGLCHCDACQRLCRARFGRAVPDTPDSDYRAFMAASTREVAAAIGDLIHRLRPRAGYFNYLQEATDGIMSESNTAVARPLPLWPYSASENVNRARNSQPGKMAVNLNMQFVDFWWRFATVPAGEIALRSWQNLAHGGALTLAINGTFDQQDRQALEAARPIFHWAADHEQYFVGQSSAARVLLLGGGEGFRGLFRLLTEEHIPFAVSDNRDRAAAYDLVISAGRAPRVPGNGKLLIVTATPPEFEIAPVVRTERDLEGYVRVRDHAAFPSLDKTDLLMLNGPFTELNADGPAPLTLVPPSMIGPPELIRIDMRDTTTPAIVTRGNVTWIPWELGSLYYRHSLPAHAALFHDVLAKLLPRRQLTSDAHPLVEMSLMRQKGRTLLHLINVTGHSQTGYFPPIPMGPIHIRLAGEFQAAKAVRAPAALPVSVKDRYTEFAVPRLTDYELVVIE
jgi:hypothetical protein